MGRPKLACFWGWEGRVSECSTTSPKNKCPVKVCWTQGMSDCDVRPSGFQLIAANVLFCCLCLEGWTKNSHGSYPCRRINTAENTPYPGACLCGSFICKLFVSVSVEDEPRTLRVCNHIWLAGDMVWEWSHEDQRPGANPTLPRVIVVASDIYAIVRAILLETIHQTPLRTSCTGLAWVWKRRQEWGGLRIGNDSLAFQSAVCLLWAVPENTLSHSDVEPSKATSSSQTPYLGYSGIFWDQSLVLNQTPQLKTK